MEQLKAFFLDLIAFRDYLLELLFSLALEFIAFLNPFSALILSLFYYFFKLAGLPKNFREIALRGSLVALALGLTVLLTFDKTAVGYHYLMHYNFGPQYNLDFTLGVDGLSLTFLLLTLFIMPICFLASWKVQRLPQLFFMCLFSIEVLLVLTFTTTDLFYFYVLFESILIPMFLLIGHWGSRERKIKAAYYFFLYTLFGSLFMLFGIFTYTFFLEVRIFLFFSMPL